MKITKEQYLDHVRDIAEEYFRSGTYFCSEAVVQTLNDELGNPLPEEVVKMASGFPIGLGKSQCLCGAISGGEMILGMMYGRTKGEPMDPKMFEVAKGLHDYIKDEYKATCCRVITKKWDGDDFKSPERKEHCITITGKVARWVAERLIEDGKLEIPAEI